MKSQLGESADVKNQVPSVARALDILELIEARQRGASLRDVEERLGIPRATAFRIIKTLEERGYLFKNGTAGEYQLGVRAIALGSGLVDQDDVSQVAQRYMSELADQTGQTVQLGVLVQYQVMYVWQVKADAPISVIVPLRRPFPVNLSAGGKALVAHLPEAAQARFLERAELARNTEKTIHTPGAFAEELAKIRAQGYAVDDEEFARGVRCIAAPIRDRQGVVVASLGLTGQSSEINRKNIRELARQVAAMADRVSRALGHAPAVRGGNV